MKERPVLFSGPMVRAILDGSKTQTRRVVKPQPTHDAHGIYWREPHDFKGIEDLCPYGQAGDRIWVRETWAVSSVYNGMPPRDIDPGAFVAYPATGKYKGLCFRPSIHMPRWASRITLEIARVRVERVQEISDFDALAEGCSTKDMRHGDRVSSVFARLWNSINAKPEYRWDANPFCWVIKFRRIDP